MFGASSNLSGRLGLGGVMALLFLVGTAQAHNLRAGHRVLSGQRVRVEGWFDGQEPASGARVQVLRNDGSVLIEGRLDERGVWVFPFTKPENLRVILRDGTGHRASIEIAERELASSLVRGPIGQALAGLTATTSPLAPLPLLASLAEPSATSASSASPLDPAEPGVDRSKPMPWREVLTGIAFLLALAAFVISLQNARELRQMRGSKSS